ncbi:serine/threonine-protein kinase [Engelhardtia mirabilis]|uniref:non-specific serine/threonine protein kinase n=1 Tax=Engelhardtia mirabilis TaxID=2528011 RepID=A0A518BJ69_9BACT|nr:Serine/threonine-protein kinase PrkC [Planctomycetes bacterium Pla133]QDV01320.1 Serine/threonine-protein kinase PrkC [Planctomycetes bacterium Pla86]
MVDWETFYSDFRKPDFVPGYEILNRLGGGAFGEVYKARKRSIGKAYAIKFLKVGDPQAAQIVERELSHARLFAAIEHPNLVAIEDLGSVAGVPYVVMGYAGEDTLARRLRDGALERRLGFDLFVQVCRGVLALHDRQLVHFDLKPSNVFLRGDVARVGDYGLAKLLTDGRQTLSIGRGTPHYMAPEVLKGRADQRADLYSLGTMLFEVFAGRVPFEGESGIAALLRDERSEIEYPADFPPPLREVVERCLAVEPAERYQSVAELLTDLDQTGRPGDSIRWPFPGKEGSIPAGRFDRAPTPRPVGVPVGADVVEWETLDGHSGSGSDEVGDDLLEWSALDRAGAERESADPSLRRSTSSFGESRASFASAPTVPVPPRHDGGFVGGVVAVGALGVEMVGAIFQGPANLAFAAGSRGVGSALRGLGGLVRWAAFSFLFGGLVAVVLVVLLLR